MECVEYINLAFCYCNTHSFAEFKNSFADVYSLFPISERQKLRDYRSFQKCKVQKFDRFIAIVEKIASCKELADLTGRTLEEELLR